VPRRKGIVIPTLNRLPTFCLIAALSLPWSPSTEAEPSHAAKNLSLAQAERNAVELKQGMSAGDVQKLLGKPRRTTLKSNALGANAQGSLQWTYSWTGASSSGGSLRVDFSAKAPDEWYVSSWDWATY